MSESSGEKTELPTPKKLRDARQKGQVARSQELVTAASLIAVIAVTWATFDGFVARMIRLVDESARLAAERDFASTGMTGVYLAAADVVAVMLPLLGVAIVVGIAANYIQVGSLFAPESIMPKLEKVNPGSGFKRIFSMKQLIEMLKSILKIVILSLLLYVVLSKSIGAFMAAPHCGLGCLGGLIDVVLFQVLVYSALAFVVVALADLAYQRHSHTKSLMMTKDEVKREYKESEGDPHIKGHRRQLAQELAMGDGGVAARKGTAAIVNPTHFTVIVSYRPESFPLPIVTAKGRDIIAHYLRAEAESAGVPVFRNVRLARGLYDSTPVDQPIPDELFEAVAEVLVWVDRNRERLYGGVLDHGVIDMDAGDHQDKDKPEGRPPTGGRPFPLKPRP